MKTFWNDKDALDFEVNKVKKLYESNPITINKETKQREIKEYLNYIRSQTGHGLHDCYKLLNMTLEIE